MFVFLRVQNGNRVCGNRWLPEIYVNYNLQQIN